MLKQYVTRDITNGKILTASGYITCPAEVGEHLHARVGSDEWKQAHVDKTIEEIVVNYTPHNEISRPQPCCQTLGPRPHPQPAPQAGPRLGCCMLSPTFLFPCLQESRARLGSSHWQHVELLVHDAREGSAGAAREHLLVRGLLRGARPTQHDLDKLICPSCTHRDKPVWVQQVVKDLGTGLAGRRTEAQAAGKKLAQMLMQPSNTTPKPNEGFLAIQARERWSTSEEVHLRPGHFWLAQLPLEREVRKIEKRTTIEGVIFHPGDYLIRIGRYFDRVASDTSGLTFEEWTPPDGGSFVVNATELRAVNFTMTPTKPPPPLVEVRRSGRRAAVVSTPPQKPPKEYTMDPAVDNDIRSRCW